MRLIANVVLRHPVTGDPTVLTEGSDLPDWAVGLIGDHVLEGVPEPVEEPATDPDDPESSEPEAEAEVQDPEEPEAEAEAAPSKTTRRSKSN